MVIGWFELLGLTKKVLKQNQPQQTVNPDHRCAAGKRVLFATVVVVLVDADDLLEPDEDVGRDNLTRTKCNQPFQISTLLPFHYYILGTYILLFERLMTRNSNSVLPLYLVPFRPFCH